MSDPEVLTEAVPDESTPRTVTEKPAHTPNPKAPPAVFPYGTSTWPRYKPYRALPWDEERWANVRKELNIHVVFVNRLQHERDMLFLPQDRLKQLEDIDVLVLHATPWDETKLDIDESQVPWQRFVILECYMRECSPAQQERVARLMGYTREDIVLVRMRIDYPSA